MFIYYGSSNVRVLAHLAPARSPRLQEACISSITNEMRDATYGSAALLSVRILLSKLLHIAYK